MAHLIDQYWVCSDQMAILLSLLSLLGPRYSLRHNSIEIRSLNNRTMSSKCSSERKSPISLTLNQKLKMIKLS